MSSATCASKVRKRVLTASQVALLTSCSRKSRRRFSNSSSADSAAIAVACVVLYMLMCFTLLLGQCALLGVLYHTNASLAKLAPLHALLLPLAVLYPVE